MPVAAALTLLTAGQAGAEFFIAQSKRVEHRDDPLSVRYATVAVTLFPWQPVYWFQLAREAVRLEPQAPEVKVAAAKVAWQFGRRADALALLDAALAFDPGHKPARTLRDELTGSPGAP